VVAATFAAVVAVLTTATRRQSDLTIFVEAVRAWMHGGALYDYLKPGTPYGFTYPPSAALLMTPMTLVSWRTLVVVQTCLSAVATVGVLAWMLAPWARRSGLPLAATTAVGLGVLAVLVPVQDVLGYGQVNLILLGLVTADLAWGVAGGRRWAGIGIGVATAIKLVPGLFVLYLIVTRRYRAARTACATFAVLTVGTAVLAPSASADFWLHRFWDVTRVGNPASGYNQSVRGALLRMGPPLDSALVWLVACAAVLGIWILGVRRQPVVDDRVGLALTGVAICLLSPIAWVHHLVWAVPALVVAFCSGRRVLAGVTVLVFGTHLPSIWLDGSLPVRAGPRNALTWVCLGLLLAVSSRWDRTAGRGQRSAPQWVPDPRSEERWATASSTGTAKRSWSWRTRTDDDARPVGHR